MSWQGLSEVLAKPQCSSRANTLPRQAINALRAVEGAYSGCVFLPLNRFRGTEVAVMIQLCKSCGVVLGAVGVS